MSGIVLGQHPGPGWAHLVGAAGAGQRSLARWLVESQWQVSGSDDSPTWPASAPAEVRSWRLAADATAPRPDLVVSSAAIPADHPELVLARRLGLCHLTYPQVLGQLSRQFPTWAVAGTHGKSTSVALVWSILRAAGRDPSVIFGAVPLGGGAGGHRGSDPCLVVEACEFRRHFLDLSPRFGAILNLEWDHVDCYPSPGDVESAFGQFAEQLAPEGVLVVPAAEPAPLRAAKRGRARLVTFGIDQAASWQARHLSQERGRYQFELWGPEGALGPIRLQVWGRHQVSCALAAAALAGSAGVPGEAILRGIEGFAGLARRTQWRGRCGEVDVIDDYAHHPTAVAATLALARQAFGNRRLVCVFEPHQVARTLALVDDFAASLDNADLVYLAPVWCARERQADGLAGRDRLTAALVRRGRPALAWAPTELAIDNFVSQLRPDDVLVLIGAGTMGTQADGIVDRLRTDSAAGRAAGAANLAAPGRSG